MRASVTFTLGACKPAEDSLQDRAVQLMHKRNSPASAYSAKKPPLPPNRARCVSGSASEPSLCRIALPPSPLKPSVLRSREQIISQSLPRKDLLRNRHTTSVSPSPSSSSLSSSSSSSSSSSASSNSSSTRNKTCLCAPTNHPGSFRCRLHRSNPTSSHLQRSANKI